MVGEFKEAGPFCYYEIGNRISLFHFSLDYF